MPPPYTGGCQCGAVRYELNGEPLTLYVCHCRDCQKQSASAFGMSMTVSADAFVVTAGKPAEFEATADSGRVKLCGFCPGCGTRLYHRAAGGANTNIKPGTLDETDWLKPVAHLWVKRKQPWITIPDDIPAFEKQPDDFRGLIETWKNQEE